MIKNTIKATIPFSFKGLEHSPSVVIDLDVFSQGEQTIDNIFHLVANENKIDNYSYEYEMLESAQVFFSEPTGIANEFMSENTFDLEGFKQRLNETQYLNTLQDIAKQTMGIEHLEENEALKSALKKAFEAGRLSAK